MSVPTSLKTRHDPLSASEIAQALATLPGWRHDQNALSKEFAFPDFRAALAWMMRAGFEAEELNHHPDWTNLYRHVTVRLNTHASGGRVTSLDVELASRLERLATTPFTARA